jgi:hypothetical protein
MPETLTEPLFDFSTVRFLQLRLPLVEAMTVLPPLQPQVSGATKKIEKVRVLVDEIRAELDAGNLS